MDKKRKILMFRLIGATIAVISSVVLYFQWQDYKMLKTSFNKFKEPYTNTPSLGVTSEVNKDAWKELMVEPLEPPSMTWKEFITYSEKKPDKTAMMLMIVDFGDPDFDEEKFFQILSSSTRVQRTNVLNAICGYDTSLTGLTKNKRDFAFKLYCRLLKEQGEKDDWFASQISTVGALLCTTCNLKRFVKYCKFLENSNNELTKILRNESYDYAKYLAFHLEKTTDADKALLKDDLVKLFGKSLLEKHCTMLFVE